MLIVRQTLSLTGFIFNTFRKLLHIPKNLKTISIQCYDTWEFPYFDHDN